MGRYLRYKNFSLATRISNLDYCHLSARTIEHVKAAGVEKLHVPVDIFQEYCELQVKLHELTRKSRASIETAQIVELNATVTRLMRVILASIRASCKNPVPEKKEAATTLYLALKQFYKTVRWTQHLKSEAVSIMAGRMRKEPLSKHVQTLGLQGEVDDMERMNEQCMALMDARSDKKVNQGKQGTKRIRRQMDELYEVFMTAIWIFSITDPSEEATAFIRSTNKLLSDITTSYRQHMAAKKRQPSVREPKNSGQG